MSGLLNLIHREATKIAERRVWARMGTISAIDLSTYTARVILHPGNKETGWLPIGTLAVGNGWGFVAPPDEGDAVLVHFRDGSLNSGVIGPRFFNRQKAPITGVQQKEFQLVHETGSKILLKANGDVVIEAAGDLDLNVTGDANVTATGQVNISGGSTAVSGNLDVDGNITATGTITEGV